MARRGFGTRPTALRSRRRCVRRKSSLGGIQPGRTERSSRLLPISTARIWDAVSGALKHEFAGHAPEVLVARFSPDGERVATGTEHGTVRLWRVETGRRRFSNRTLKVGVSRRWRSARMDATLVTGLCGWQRRGFGIQPTAQAIGRSVGRSRTTAYRICTPCSVPTATRVDDFGGWDRRGYGKRRLAIPRVRPSFTKAASSLEHSVPTDRWSSPHLSDNSARLWDVRTGLPLCQPLRENERILHAGFSPDGRRLVTASWDRIVQIWNIQPRRFLRPGDASCKRCHYGWPSIRDGESRGHRFGRPDRAVVERAHRCSRWVNPCVIKAPVQFAEFSPTDGASSRLRRTARRTCGTRALARRLPVHFSTRRPSGPRSSARTESEWSRHLRMERRGFGTREPANP